MEAILLGGTNKFKSIQASFPVLAVDTNDEESLLINDTLLEPYLS